MRKVKLAVGVWAALRHGAYPYLLMGKVKATTEHSVYFENAQPYHHAPNEEVAFCIAEQHYAELGTEIERLRTKHEQAMATMERVMGDHRRRSVLGQLDPL